MEPAYLGCTSVSPGSDRPQHLTRPETWMDTAGAGWGGRRMVQVDECACELFLNQSN